MGGTFLLMTMFCHAQNGVKEKTVSDLYNAVKSETDVNRMEALVVEMEKKSGEATGGVDLIDVSRRLLATAFAEQNQPEKAVKWASRIPDSVGKDYTLFGIVEALASAGKTGAAEKVLMPLWEQYKTREPSGSGQGFYPRITLADLETQYGILLYRKGEFRKALPYLEPSEAAGKSRLSATKRADYYAMSLAKNGETAKALEAMNARLLAPGHRSEELKSLAEKVYVKQYGNPGKYLQLMDSLETEAQKKMDAKVSKLEVNETAPDFTLTDLNGKTVSLKSLRGKTVILDFWATWCQPCVASFPGMQKAVDYFQKDTSVVFLFIHTAEHSDDPVGDVKRFMGNKKYRFDVFMDLRNKETKRNAVADAFNVRNIPAKFIIDGAGKIRFKNTGYVSEEEAVREISTMVKHTRSN